MKKALFDLSSRNPFINVRTNQLWVNGTENEDTLKKLHSKSQFLLKEYGLETTLQVEVFLKWTHSQTQSDISGQRFFVSPLIYRPCNIVRSRKISTSYRIDTDEEELVLNPILKHFFQQEFDIRFPYNVSDVETFLEDFSRELTEGLNEVNRTHTFNDEEGWQFILCPAVGIFNYKKSLLGEDYDLIIEQPSLSVRHLLEGNNEAAVSSSDVVAMNELDDRQKLIVEQSTAGNLTIQGPPGTGKSHTIVSMIANFLAQDKKVLFVSEKRSALEVVYDRLKKQQLHHWVAYFHTGRDEKRDFYAHLNKAWEQVNDFSTSWEETDFLHFSESELFRFFPNDYNEYRTNIDGNLHQLITLLLKDGRGTEELKLEGRVPSFSDWKLATKFLNELEEKMLENEKGQLQDLLFTKLNKAILLENEPILTLSKRLDKIIKNLNRIIYVQEQFGLDEQFDKISRLSIAASVMGMVNKTQLELLVPESKAYKSFDRLAKKYELLRNKLRLVQKENEKWEKKPEPAELIQLIDLLKNTREPRGILKLLQRRSTWLSETFKNFDPNLSDAAKIQLLESIQQEWRLKTELDEIKLKLKHELQLLDPDQEIDHIIKLRNKLESISHNESMTILEHEQSLDLIQNLVSLNPSVSEVNNLQRFILRDVVSMKSEELLQLFTDIREALPFLKRWLPEIADYFKLAPDIQEFLGNNSGRIDDLTVKVAYHNLLTETRFEPKFNELSGRKLSDEFKRLSVHQKQVFQTNRRRTGLKRVNQFREWEKLLKVPASKLDSTAKERKKEYRSERKMIIHEIGKRQQHMPVKQFYQSCRETLMELQPVWMMNPLAVSGFLPCEAELFDVVIFDEASQIPLEDAIPSVFRSKQVIVVGDSEQMPPSQFFSTKSDTATILQEAEVAYPSKMLTWHYRSEHPDLIQFSNQVFYENELRCLPPVSFDQPVELLSVEGLFNDGRNEIEAKAVADYCAKLSNEELEHTGIIAFSREQENEILRQLKKNKVADDAYAFVRNLENVQGIECEHVIISIGYARNDEGVFRQNFGPVNQDLGANRLNVLFSRAKRKMTVFSSVESLDFKLTDNNGVQVLRDFLRYAEGKRIKTQSEAYAAYAHEQIGRLLEEYKIEVEYVSTLDGAAVSAFVSPRLKRILLVDPGTISSEVNRLFPLLSAIDQRFKKSKIVLSVDLWMNRQRMEEEIIKFFQD